MIILQYILQLLQCLFALYKFHVVIGFSALRLSFSLFITNVGELATVTHLIFKLRDRLSPNRKFRRRGNCCLTSYGLLGYESRGMHKTRKSPSPLSQTCRMFRANINSRGLETER